METDSIWEEMAKRYDTEDRVNIANIIVQAIRLELNNTKEKTALGYGCGTGLIGLGLTDMFKSMLLVDPSVQMIEQVNQKIKTGHIECAKTLCCDFLEEVPSTLQVDYIIMSQVLLHIKNSRLILTRLYNTLNADGHLFVVDFDKNKNIISDKVHNGFVQGELIELLKQIGFTSAVARTFHYGNAIFMNKDGSLFILDAVK
jgi:ubiquinone/menaquinone biosynthesis C-methylase UbiE